ncbi:MAG TPA: hypothetical protein VF653_07215 [Methylomirabilota bacterium]
MKRRAVLARLGAAALGWPLVLPPPPSSGAAGELDGLHAGTSAARIRR